MVIPMDEPVDLMFAFQTMNPIVDTFYRPEYTGSFNINIDSTTGAVQCSNMIRF